MSRKLRINITASLEAGALRVYVDRGLPEAVRTRRIKVYGRFKDSRVLDGKSFAKLDSIYPTHREGLQGKGTDVRIQW